MEHGENTGRHWIGAPHVPSRLVGGSHDPPQQSVPFEQRSPFTPQAAAQIPPTQCDESIHWSLLRQGSPSSPGLVADPLSAVGMASTRDDMASTTVDIAPDEPAGPPPSMCPAPPAWPLTSIDGWLPSTTSMFVSPVAASVTS